MTPLLARAPALWAAVAAGGLVAAWLLAGWAHPGLPVAALALASFALGRVFEQHHRVHRKLKASIRRRPIPVVHAPTEMDMRVIPPARRPSLTRR